MARPVFKDIMKGPNRYIFFLSYHIGPSFGTKHFSLLLLGVFAELWMYLQAFVVKTRLWNIRRVFLAAIVSILKVGPDDFQFVGPNVKPMVMWWYNHTDPSQIMFWTTLNVKFQEVQTNVLVRLTASVNDMLRLQPFRRDLCKYSSRFHFLLTYLLTDSCTVGWIQYFSIHVELWLLRNDSHCSGTRELESCACGDSHLLFGSETYSTLNQIIAVIHATLSYQMRLSTISCFVREKYVHVKELSVRRICCKYFLQSPSKNIQLFCHRAIYVYIYIYHNSSISDTVIARFIVRYRATAEY